MKKRSFLTAAALTLVAATWVSCEKEPVDEPSLTPGGHRITASLDGVTRTSLNGVEVLWSAGDRIKVFYTEAQQSASADYVLQSGEGTKKAVFAAESSEATGEGLKALYPASAWWNYVGVADTLIPCTLPATQTLQANSFATNTMPMFGAVSDPSAPDALAFRNCAALFVVRLAGSGTVSKIELVSTSRYLAGPGVIDISDPAQPVMYMEYRPNSYSYARFSDQAVQTVTLDCGNTQLTAEAKEFPFVVPIVPAGLPYSNRSLTFNVYDGNGDLILTQTSSSSKTPVRNGKYLFPVWTIHAAADTDISAALQDALQAGVTEVKFTAPVTQDMTITLPASEQQQQELRFSLPVESGKITIVAPSTPAPAAAGNGAATAVPTKIYIANTAAASTAEFDIDLAGSTVEEICFYGKAQNMTSNAKLLKLPAKVADKGYPEAEVQNITVTAGELCVTGGHMVNSPVLEGEGYVTWTSSFYNYDFNCTCPAGWDAYWMPNPHSSYGMVRIWSKEPLFNMPGKGTQAEPYELSTADHFNRIGWQFATSLSGTRDLYAETWFKVTAPIDFTGVKVYPWGYADFPSSPNKSYPFAGHFDGGNQTLSNIVIPSGYCARGLFGYTHGAEIRNVVIEGIELPLTYSMDNARWAGALAGRMNGGSLTDCTVTNVKIPGTSTTNVKYNTFRLGGLVGLISGGEAVTIMNCSASGITIEGWFSLGGLVGSVQSPTTLTGCSVANVSLEHAYGSADNYYSSSPVIGDSFDSVTINDLTLGAWTITTTHAATSPALWAARTTAVWPYVGDRAEGAAVTVDNIQIQDNSTLSEADMSGTGPVQ